MYGSVGEISLGNSPLGELGTQELSFDKLDQLQVQKKQLDHHRDCEARPKFDILGGTLFVWACFFFLRILSIGQYKRVEGKRWGFYVFFF